MSTPRWQRIAEAGYALLLHAYPRRIREQHGEEMQQAFRDRCREVSAGHNSAWRLLGTEIAPDLASSLASAHLEEPTMPRARTSLIAFALLACAWLFQDAISKVFLDAFSTAHLHYQNWSEQRAVAHDEAKVRALADRLIAGSSERERSLAAYLYAINYANHRWMLTSVAGTEEKLPIAQPDQDGLRAKGVLASLSRTSDPKVARIALAACPMVAGCDRLAHAQWLVRLEPGNAFAWSEVLKEHSSDAAVRADLRQIAASRYYDDSTQEALGALWRAARQSAPDDAGTFGALGRQMLGAGATIFDYDDYSHGLMGRCQLAWPGAQTQPLWLSKNPASRPDCRRAAVLLANSGEPYASRWGWYWLDRDQPSAQTRAGVRGANAHLLKLGEVGGTQGAKYSWRPWTDAEWMAWGSAKAAAN